MEVSEARRAANIENSKHAKGPTSERGKAISRRNSLKHGLTGEGIVLLEGDQAEVEGRVEALRDELHPQSSLGSMLIRKIATFSVRSERAAERENASVAERVRNAVDVFDEERGRRVDALFNALFDDPRGSLRNLRRMPEGVDRLLEAWRTLRRDLDLEGQHRWGSPQLARAANLSGVPHLDAHSTRIGDLSPGYFIRLSDSSLESINRYYFSCSPHRRTSPAPDARTFPLTPSREPILHRSTFLIQPVAGPGSRPTPLTLSYTSRNTAWYG